MSNSILHGGSQKISLESAFYDANKNCQCTEGETAMKNCLHVVLQFPQIPIDQPTAIHNHIVDTVSHV